MLLCLFACSFLYSSGQSGFDSFEGKELQWTIKEKKPGLFNKIDKDKIAIQIVFRNQAEESIQLKFQLFVYQKGIAKSESDQTAICLKSGKKKKTQFMIDPLGSDEEWRLENASASIVENCPTK